VIYAEAEREREILPLIEEGLREKGLAAVVGEVTRMSSSPRDACNWRLKPQA
jgi:protein ImuA